MSTQPMYPGHHAVDQPRYPRRKASTLALAIAIVLGLVETMALLRVRLTHFLPVGRHD